MAGAPAGRARADPPEGDADGVCMTGEANNVVEDHRGARRIHHGKDPAKDRRKTFSVYLLILVAFLAVQFGHGSNIGLAVSLPGESKAMNLALGSWVMVGVCLGLPLTPWACRRFGVFEVCAFCVVLDFIAILLMLWPGIGLRGIYAVRFLVGFFEAPLLPYLQEWLARFGKHTWTVWNTILHAMVPVGENLGYIMAQELVQAGFAWQWAFAGQAVVFISAVAACYLVGGRAYLDLSQDRNHSFVEEDGQGVVDDCSHGDWHNGGVSDSPDSPEEASNSGEVEYPATERWVVYWATNASLAAQLGFLSGTKYVIRDYAQLRNFSVHGTIFTFSTIALIGPALGGSIAMSGSVIRPDRWGQHRKTLSFLTCTATLAAVIASLLPYTPDFAFWLAMFCCFVTAGGVYPAAQGIINIALTQSRVIEASVYQVQCNNIFFGMPLPFVIGKMMDDFGVKASFHCVILLQLLTAAGFSLAWTSAACTEERSAWHRLLPMPRQPQECQE